MIERYSRPEMKAIWTEEGKFERWLEVEIAVCEVLAERGEIPAEAVAVIREKAAVDPVRSRYHELMDDRGELTRLLRVGADKARTIASGTLERVHDAIGMLPA